MLLFRFLFSIFVKISAFSWTGSILGRLKWKVAFLDDFHSLNAQSNSDLHFKPWLSTLQKYFKNKFEYIHWYFNACCFKYWNNKFIWLGFANVNCLIMSLVVAYLNFQLYNNFKTIFLTNKIKTFFRHKFYPYHIYVILVIVFKQLSFQVYCIKMQ